MRMKLRLEDDHGELMYRVCIEDMTPRRRA